MAELYLRGNIQHQVCSYLYFQFPHLLYFSVTPTIRPLYSSMDTRNASFSDGMDMYIGINISTERVFSPGLLSYSICCLKIIFIFQVQHCLQKSPLHP